MTCDPHVQDQASLGGAHQISKTEAALLLLSDGGPARPEVSNTADGLLKDVLDAGASLGRALEVLDSAHAVGGGVALGGADFEVLHVGQVLGPVGVAGVDLEADQEDGDAGAVHVQLVEPLALGVHELAVAVDAEAEEDGVPLEVRKHRQLVQLPVAGRVPDLQVRELAVDVDESAVELVAGRVPVAVEAVKVEAAAT